MAALPAPPAAGPQLDWGAIGGAFNILAQQVPMIPGALNQVRSRLVAHISCRNTRSTLDS